MKIGFVNKSRYNVHVVFKKEGNDVLLPPGKRTNKEFDEKEIISVQSMPLQQAVAKGIISIVR